MAALDLVTAGTFRPEPAALAEKAGVHKSAINRHFGAVHLLHRVIAREYPGAVIEALGLQPVDDPKEAGLLNDIVWAVMTGGRRPR